MDTTHKVEGSDLLTIAAHAAYRVSREIGDQAARLGGSQRRVDPVLNIEWVTDWYVPETPGSSRRYTIVAYSRITFDVGLSVAPTS